MSRLAMLVAALAVSGCLVSGEGSMSAGTTPVVVYQEPPPPQVETVTVRTGYLWIKGRWRWQGGQWVWVGGHWERERSGYAWTEGHWDHRGNTWVWVDGTWNTAPAAPPPTATVTPNP